MVRNILRLSHKLSQTLLQMPCNIRGRDLAIATNDLCEQFFTHDRIAILLLVGYDLQKSGSRDVVAALFVDNNQIGVVKNEALDVGNCYVAACLCVV